MSTFQAVAQQAPETYNAPILSGPQKARLTPTESANLGNDPTPFGVRLSKIVLVDERNQGRRIKSRRDVSGVKTIGLGSELAPNHLEVSLAPFLGRELSFRMITEIQTAVVVHYRQQNRPLVSVTIPPQEISDGGLQINILTFVAAQIVVESNSKGTDNFISDQIRLSEGQQIDSSRLEADLNWLSLNPYRDIDAIFEPGSVYGATDLVLRANERRPWSAYVGAANTGTRSTGQNRMFAGFNTATLPWHDHQLSYLFVANPESLGDGDVFSVSRSQAYLSHSLTYFAPLTFDNGRRAKLTIKGSYVSDNAELDSFFASQKDYLIMSGELAFPLAGRLHETVVWPEVFGRIEAKREDRDTLFNGIPVFAGRTKLTQLVLGYRGRYSCSLWGNAANGSAEMRLAMGRYDTNVGLSDTYAYAGLSVQHASTLSGGASVVARLTGQYANNALPDLERLGLGGAGTVRGYETSEVSTNSGLALSVELRGTDLLKNVSTAQTRLNPFAFVDYGFAQATLLRPNITLASVGVGLQLDFANSFSATLQAARALRTGLFTQKGDYRIHFNIVARF
ncbi:ShlB/FhaC/HecB family hemolysin secretion/activation protein [Parasedimentitalea maritima]|uniref:ShlB/FhaC/HecB family hemolysin secretion/activation protein n=1 Tax=Parasedimentitalea maritima TaxID=2578117 RepID=UPI00131AB0B1|nr:ShlB/FhaC/HecB family hemolysin secretion/activation protein [Zongyanglinia marina]